MENTTYALQIAAGTMIAVMVIALITYVFRALSTYQENQDSIVERESITEFNEAFEVYDKNLMYGTDVLSCLNKAEDNNQKYVYSIYYGTDSSSVTYEAREEYMINVSVTINTALSETIEVTGTNSLGTLTQLTASQCSSAGYAFKPFSSSGTSGYFNLPEVTYYYFTTGSSRTTKVNKVTSSYDAILWTCAGALKTTDTLTTGTFPTSVTAGTYELENDSTNSTNTGLLVALLSTVTDNEQIIYNESWDSSSGAQDWYSATWTTAVNDFKTRKFTCTGIEYNETTGYIDSISFEEYTS